MWMSTDALPSVSIVIPARNAAGVIRSAIESARSQDYAGSIEIVVADGMSTDGTRSIAESMGCVVVSNPGGTTPDGLNAAIAASAGQVIVRCDAQAQLPTDYVSTAVGVLKETGAANVGGLQDAVGEGFMQRAIAIAQSTPLGVGDARYRLGGEPGEVDTVYLGVFDRTALADVGGFDPLFERNQDYELNWRLRQAGYQVWFDPRLRVRYTPRAGLGALARQYYDYGRWKRQMLHLHPRSLRPRQLAAPALVLGLLASIGVALSGAGEPASLIPGLYLLVITSTTVFELVRRKTVAALGLPLAIPTMHLCWGAGFLIGQRTRSR
jgi:glycosyltransferase involved in cell wall biosynthesis